MRYYKEPDVKLPSLFGTTYTCDHPCYNECTLYSNDDGKTGIAIIQQRYDKITKHTWWGCIDPWLADDIYLNKDFSEFLTGHAEEPKDGIYPTFAIRQVMRRLHMKPLEKQVWETRF